MHRFNELFGGQQAVDRVRNQRMPAVGPTLDYLGICFDIMHENGTLIYCYRGSVHV